MFLSISRFSVANDLDDAVRAAFVQRAHQVDAAPGFIRMEVANASDDAKAFWLLTPIRRVTGAAVLAPQRQPLVPNVTSVLCDKLTCSL